MLREKRFEELKKIVPNDVEKIMDAPIIRTLVREVGLTQVQLFLEIELVRLASRMNVANNLTDAQIPFVAETLLETYPTETLQDFILCFRRGAMGFYGMTYHQLDCAIIMSWMEKHIEEKAMYRERDNANSRKAEPDYPLVDYDAFKKKISEAKQSEIEQRIKSIEQSSEEMEFKKTYKPLTLEELDAKEKHVAYLSAKWKHDHDPGNKGVEFEKEEKWNKQ